MRGWKGLLVCPSSLFPSATVSFFFFSQLIVLSKGKQVHQDLNHVIFWSLLILYRRESKLLNTWVGLSHVNPSQRLRCVLINSTISRACVLSESGLPRRHWKGMYCFFFFFDMNLHRFQTDLALSETHIEIYFMIVLYISEAVSRFFCSSNEPTRMCFSGSTPCLCISSLILRKESFCFQVFWCL